MGETSVSINESSDLGPPDQSHVRSLGVLQLIAISFFTVSGGPYGIEAIVGTAPIGIVLLSFVVIPILWSCPLALITAELSSMIPHDGGSVLWTREGFGGAIGWINGICSWLVFLLDSALYPAVMLTYVERLTGNLHPVVGFCLMAAFVFAVLCVNLRSALEVGWLAEILGIVSIMPFIAFIVYAIVTGSVKHFDFEFHYPKADIGLLLSLSIWNSAGWEDVGMLAGEVRNPSRTFPIGLVGSLLLQTVCNILPIYIGFAVDHDYSQWDTGYFATLAHRVGGQWVYVLMLIGAFVSNIGLLHANTVSASRLVAWMSSQKEGSRAWFPPFFGRLYSKHAVPRAAVILNCVIIAILTALPFDILVQADVFLMCASYVFIFITFCILRFKRPSASRPFRLPAANKYIACLYIVIPVGFVIFQAVTQPWLVITVGGGLIVGSTALYFIIFVFLNGWLNRKHYQELVYDH